jgi:hypothetical protein
MILSNGINLNNHKLLFNICTLFNFYSIFVNKTGLLKHIILYTFFCFIFVFAKSQQLINLRNKTIPVSDTLKIDSLPLAPGSVLLFNKNYKILTDADYIINYAYSQIIFKSDPGVDSLIIQYRVLSYDFTKPIFILNPDDFLKRGNLTDKEYDFIYRPEDLRAFQETQSSLSRRGSISRGISFGNTQNVIVNSALDLQLEGKLSENLNIVAVISDSNIPIQPDGTAQQIQEFDKVFINLFTDNFSLLAGDFEERKPAGYFMNYFKKVQGARVSVKSPATDNRKYSVESSASGAVAKGKNHRMEFDGIEGNQGPYRLTGANNETFIVVLAGSERVYIDGIQLTRGQDKDYVIDYNLGEIVFTSRQPINKDKRIVIEFEYSDRNYARFLFTNNNLVKTEKSSFHINILSEGDAKNQAFDQDLRDTDKLLLSQIGDDIDRALIPGFDSLGFDADEIRYALIDTIVNGIVYDTVFVYSTDENSAHYSIRFAFVGANRGNFIKSLSAANGRVFEWIAPENGIPQGDYMPMRLIITPKKKQMISLGGKSEFTESTNIGFEIALSNNDINTFSKLDAENNTGFAMRFDISQLILKRNKNTISSSAFLETTGKNFEAIENYRSQEFKRDWNLASIYPENNEYLTGLNLAFKNTDVGHAEYRFNFMNRESQYQGLKNTFSSGLGIGKWRVLANASLLNSEDPYNFTRFLRHNARLERDLGIFVIGLAELQEYNLWTNPGGDSIRQNSFNFNQYEAFIKTNDSITNSSYIGYKFRSDELPKDNKLSYSTEAHDFSFSTDIVSNPTHRFSAGANYRRLFVKDTLLYAGKPEDNMTGRLEHSLRLLRGAISTSSFYEIGSGLERKIEFSYLEVAPGQGVYMWTDYNNNGIKELDEFEIAHFADQASYIRIITPSNEYIKTYSNMFNQNIILNPTAVWRNEQGIKKFLSRFSNQFAYRLSGKNTSSEFKEFANPFAGNVDDVSLVSMTSSIRNNLAFNKFNPKFNIEYIHQSNNNKIMLVSGFDTRSFSSDNILISSQITNTFRIQNNLSIGNKSYNSEFFGNRDYVLDLFSNNSTISFQPNINNRINLSYIYQTKENLSGDEYLNGHNLGLEYRMSSVNRGTVNFQANYVFFGFEGNTGGPVAYEMLEGLMPGRNFTWTIGFQRQLAGGLQINLNYNGRKSPDTPAVHTGGVQLRAFF